MTRRPHRVVVVLGALALAVTACGDDRPAGGPAGDTLTGSVRVFTAASLTDAFTEMGKAFEAEHPNVEIRFNFAASSALAQQLNEGGPADVFVAADEANMKKVTDAGNAADPTTIARNRVAILVEKGNPKGITGLADLADPEVIVVLCAPEVPCGRFGAAALAKAGVSAKPSSLEENVKAVVSKVTLGEADAGIVYATDVKAVGDAAEGVAIDIAGDPALEATYPIAVTKASSNPKAAAAWVEYVVSDEGRATLAEFGFLPA